MGKKKHVTKVQSNDKLRNEAGNPCVAGNYAPCWRANFTGPTYPVKGRWPENLWQARKLTHEKYEAYLFACRDGVLPRMRNLDACKEHETASAAQTDMAERVKRIRGNSALFQPFPAVPAAQAWLDVFKTDQLRYPILVALGASRSRKTEWAKSLFRNALEVKIGALRESHGPPW